MPDSLSLRHINLFSCIGGMPLGFEMINPATETILLHEPNKTCRHLLRNYWDAPITSTPKELDKELENRDKRIPIDVISARYRKPKDWPVIQRTIRTCKPAIVIIEGMASVRRRWLGAVLRDLWALGYDAEGHAVSAARLGAAYGGERFVVIAHPNPDRRNALGLPETKDGDMGKQYVTNGTIDEYGTWLDRYRREAGGAFSDKPRILRRDDRISKWVDYARLRFISDDVSPMIAGLLGFCALKFFGGEYEEIPSDMQNPIGIVRDAGAKKNLCINTQKVSDSGIQYEVKKSGLWLVIKDRYGMLIDYWPSTDRYRIRGQGIRGFGINDVLKRCEIA